MTRSGFGSLAKSFQLGIEKAIEEYSRDLQDIAPIIKSALTKEELDQYNKLTIKLDTAFRDAWMKQYDKEVKEHVKRGGVSGSFSSSKTLQVLQEYKFPYVGDSTAIFKETK